MKEQLISLYRDGKLTAKGIADAVFRGWMTHADVAELLGEDEGIAVSKAAKISKSKQDLADYIAAHPLQWTDGEYYSITAEKQAQLTATIVCAQADGQAPEWNSTADVCRAWDIVELSSLGVAIKNRVKALVKYQQTQEVAMRNACTLEELEAIVVDYDSVSEEVSA